MPWPSTVAVVVYKKFDPNLVHAKLHVDLRFSNLEVYFQA